MTQPRSSFLEFPLLKRELVGLLRTRKAFWLLLSVVAGSCLLPILNWPTAETSMLFGYQVVSLFGTFFISQLTLALLVIPAFTAGAISGERERETYELLYSSQLSPFSIIFSKTLASTGYVLLLLLASAPAVCVLYLLGGVSFGTILKCYAVIFAAAVASGLICLKQSMRSRRTAHAAIRGVMWVAFWNGGLLILLMIGILVIVKASDTQINAGRMWSEWTMALSPFSTIFVELLGYEISPMARTGSLWEVWFLNVLFSGVVSSVQLIYLLRMVRTPELSVSRRREQRLLKKTGRAALGPRRALFAKALLELGESGVPFLQNPVFLKEVRSEFFSRPWYRRIMFFGPLILLVSILIIANGEWGAVLAASSTALVLIMLVTPAIAASAVPREIEHGNLDFLRGTLLPLKSVLAGKFLASLYASWGLVAAALWTILISAITCSRGVAFRAHASDSSALQRDLLCASVILMTYLFVNALATFASAISARTVGALVIAYILVLAVFLGWPIFMEMVNAGEVFMGSSPFATLVAAGRWYFEEYESKLSILLTFFWIYGAASVALLGLSMLRVEARARDR